MTRRNHMKLNIPMCLGLVLLCLTLISIHFTSGLYAKYVSKNDAEDSARVAKFDVVVSPKDLSLNDVVLATMESNSDDKSSCVLTIDNKSEVAVNYELLLEYKSGNSKGITHSFLRGNKDAQKGSLEPASKIDDIELLFSVDWDNFTKDVTKNSVKEETLKFRVIVKITQID